MVQIKTALTSRLNLYSPIISGPMAGAATPEMVVAVARAGGLGGIGAGSQSSWELKTQIQAVRKSLDIPEDQPVPMIVGFIGWCLDRTEASDDPRLIAVLEQNPVAVWFAFGVDLGRYIDQVHAYNARTGRNIFIFVLVSSVEEARRAADKNVDALVVQGNEAGGHGPADSLPLIVLLAAVLREFGMTKDKRQPLVIAAGGISTGAQTAGLLSMGADGVALGTRFLFTHECSYSEAKKQALLEADLNSTTRTMAFDEVLKFTHFAPLNCDGRAISNKIIDDLKAGLGIEERVQKFEESARQGDNSRLVVWAGSGVGMTDEIKGAADILHDLHEEVVKRLQSVSKLLA
ncbi:Nitronate monooxygenase [Favolaschia claudopus]|uniref:Nitronate monooxygenase n=1 Tax=Favolaschia claudopus TaxID=2862362 RepID=A0AAW0CS01_9AGAR